MVIKRHELAKMIDHTLLRPHATEDEIRILCEEAKENNFCSVSVNPTWTKLCAQLLKDTPIKVDVCIGFPLGATTAHVKVLETEEAIRNGAQEIDMVINIGALKSGYTAYVEKEIAAIVKTAKNVPVKVILETSYLSTDEKVAVCEMAIRTGASFVKTSTGYGIKGATVEDVQLLRKAVGNLLGVKAAGGIRTYGEAVTMIEAGANRIGTSTSLDILQDAPL
ncbi:MAG TPA: deoxyribose-phosphate aldolase [Candidatus Hydrogenedens sp.]|nr:deoxyribose-phosphate aldolase [Candidatus Hydrogenedens sp.]HOK08767.1 deoxyribose-phosphate aldolase [Candidatus Hydrogenedens sp.]